MSPMIFSYLPFVGISANSLFAASSLYVECCAVIGLSRQINKMAGHRIVKVGGSGPGEGSSKDIGLESGVNRPKCIPDVGVVKYT